MVPGFLAGSDWQITFGHTKTRASARVLLLRRPRATVSNNSPLNSKLC